eukprot:TRINITY_DN5211_c1_g1_i1.p1 TRINITY_DN5211_c1_g1~~TRINITY_DN5211_c1_g1_i1.p1  ORF type:complete len:728 (+),score=206.32 TRINITY_DN5211_c1_g1_i1:59-2242(+)
MSVNDGGGKLVFVYGSLMQGKHNHRLLRVHRGDSAFLGKARLLGPPSGPPYVMVDNGGHPHVYESADGGSIFGELYRCVPRVVENVDALQRHPTWYKRQERPAVYASASGEKQVQVWVYLYTDVQGCKYLPRVPEGNWRSYAPAHSPGSGVGGTLQDVAVGQAARQGRIGQISQTLQPTRPQHDQRFEHQILSVGSAARNLEDLGIHPKQEFIHNAPVAKLYQLALKETGTVFTSSGALAAYSGLKTGRSPKDKRVVKEATTESNVWWGPVNFPLDESSFLVNRERAVDYLNTQERLFVFDGFAGWDERFRLKVRIVCSRAYHALFMHNMLIRPTAEELDQFGQPDFTVYNAGCFPCNRRTTGMSSSTSVAMHFARKEMVILGTQYAGEMKKGILTLMMHEMVCRGALPLHSSANEAKDGTTTLFFGLSGTGKTTLSADPKRMLIGDDEHVWHDDGVFNIEGGCYAKCVGLKRENEPEIYDAIRFGSVVENCVLNNRFEIDFDDTSITENTRCAYPLEFIPNAKLPSVGGHPTNVILLTCDAFGVLPPVSKLTPEQTMYHFISGYTAKVAGTEEGVKEPQPNFSACFGGPFLVWHPTKYATMLAEKLRKFGAEAWLVNTGWTGGKYGTGSRIKLRYTRAIIDAIHDGTLAKGGTDVMPGFGLHIPKSCKGVPTELLSPWKTWSSEAAYRAQLNSLAKMFRENFANYQDRADKDLLRASPQSWPEAHL